MFDPWLVTSSDSVDGVISNLRATYGMRYPSQRKRKQKARDAASFERIFRAIYVNLAYAAALGASPPAVAISLRSYRQKHTRYDAQGLSSLPQVVEQLASTGLYLVVRRSTQRQIASTIETRVTAFKWETKKGSFTALPEHFGRVEGRELIRLSRSIRHRYEEAEEDQSDHDREGKLVDYTEDTESSRRYRAELLRINRHLAGAQLGLEADLPARMGVFAQRELCRYFKLPEGEDKPRFDLCGRLFGGWWQELPSSQRHHIRIDGEPIADLDFRSMFLRLAYLRAGLPSPAAGDLYAGVWRGTKFRDGLKKVVNAMLFRTTPLTKFPRGAKQLFPRGASASEVREAILAAHHSVAHMFEAGVGLSLMFTESEIMVATLLRLVDQGVTALPMHDGLMVAASKAATARKAMEEAARDFTGFRLPTTTKLYRR
ncbi:hypothetical protein J3R73_002032 [Labrys monachus]|uniref:DNA-directed DNA polymerase family A palm domain-containing protein n=2 Tax=Labrys monachus TaxID=217067 RepID=A0ABU0FCA7_9HYPH|nr:hypothetical protein [Labrys monachus]